MPTAKKTNTPLPKGQNSTVKSNKQSKSRVYNNNKNNNKNKNNNNKNKKKNNNGTKNTLPIPVNCNINTSKEAVQQYASIFNNPTGNANELIFRSTVYPDYKYEENGAQQNVNSIQYTFEVVENNPFNGLSGLENNLCRIKHVHFHALPKFVNDGVASNTLLAMYALPVQNGGTTSANSVTSACQRSTILTPTSVSDWVYIGGFSQDKVFGTSTFAPTMTFDYQVIGTLAIVDPETLTPVVDSDGKQLPIQLKITVEYAITLPPMFQMDIREAGNIFQETPDFGDFSRISEATAAEQILPAQCKFIRAQRNRT